MIASASDLWANRTEWTDTSPLGLARGPPATYPSAGYAEAASAIGGSSRLVPDRVAAPPVPSMRQFSFVTEPALEHQYGVVEQVLAVLVVVELEPELEPGQVPVAVVGH
jgi:hypothetical protein